MLSELPTRRLSTIRARLVTILTLLALALAALPAPAAYAGTTTTIGDKASCEAAGGRFSFTSTCSLGSYTVAAGDTLELYHGFPPDIVNEVEFGSLRIHGTLVAPSIPISINSGFVNSGTVDVWLMSIFGVAENTGTINVDGRLNLFAPFTNAGTINLTCGSRFNDNGTYTGAPPVTDCTGPSVTASATKADGTLYTPGTWTELNVTVRFSCTDEGWGVAACPTEQVISADGTFTASGTARDNAGNTTTASFGPIQIDKSSPTITGSGTKVDGSSYTAGSWSNQNVTVHWTCADAGSGVSSCPSDQLFSTNGTFGASGIAIDNLIHFTTGRFEPIQIDKNPPTITASTTKADGTPYTLGTWANQNVLVHFSCHDTGGSDVASCATDQEISPDGTFTAVGTVRDAAGNTATVSVGPIQIDKNEPSVSASGAKADGTAYTPDTWTNQNVTVHFTCTDTGSGVSFCSGDQVISPDGIWTSVGTAYDNLGHTGTGSFGPIKIDKTAPTTSGSASVSGTQATVTLNASDALSGVAATSYRLDGGALQSYTGPFTVSSAGAHTVTFFSVDVAGNREAERSTSFNIAAPTPTATHTPVPTATNTPTNTPVPTSTAMPTATNTPTNTPVPTNTPTNTPVPTATNTPVPPTSTPTSTPTATPILYNWSGFFQPVDNLPTVNSVKAGQAIPFKFSLGGNQGLGIFASGYPISQQIACGTNMPIDDIEQTVTAGASGLQYDTASGQYTYVWKTEKAWAGSCRQLVVRLIDGTDHIASFTFK